MAQSCSIAWTIEYVQTNHANLTSDRDEHRKKTISLVESTLGVTPYNPNIKIIMLKNY